MSTLAVATVCIVFMLGSLGYRLTKIRDELAGIREELARLRGMVP